MPSEILKHHVRLVFGEGTPLNGENLSGAAFSGENLWVAGDELCAVNRFTSQPAESGLCFGEVKSYQLADYLDLPDAANAEADIEGLDVADGYLWLMGSHSLKRKKPKRSRSMRENLARLASLKCEPNRYLLARIPLVQEADQRTLAREDGDRFAASLLCEDKGNSLTQLLKHDEHLAPFLHIPGKDNGFDLEGIAVRGDRVLLGLRGPVLRGWAALLELRLEAKHGRLKLCEVGNSGARLRKHFIDLDGRGVRDLHWEGGDLYLLAGPTMVLDGDVHVYRWPNALGALDGVATQDADMVWHEGPQDMMLFPHAPGGDRAEALTRIPPSLVDNRPAWLVLYDSPCAQRHADNGSVWADALID